MYVIMIGDIYGNDTPLYYPDDKEYTIYGTNLHLEVSLCGEFTFNVPKANPVYTLLKEFKIITILKDSKEIWRGYIKEARENTDKSSMYVYCVEDLAYLKSIPIAPVQQSVDRTTKLQSIISTYNAMTGIAGTVKTFEAGYVINTGTGLWEAEYNTTMLDALRTLAGEDQYVRVRREYVNGVLHRYVDLVTLPYFGVISNQKIEFGENLRDLAKEINTSWMLNVIRPYGNEIEGAEVYDGCPRRLEGTVLTNSTSIEQYGRIEKIILFETSNLTDLNNKAAAYLEQNKDPRLTLELSVIDLSQAGYNINGLNLGDKARVISTPCGIDQYVYITELNIDIQDLGRNFVTLSSTVTTGRTLTEQQAAITKEITKKIPDAISILNTAKANAIALLDGSNGGNIYFVFDESGQIVEQGFTDNPDLTQATKMSRWNLNGKAILTRDTPQDEWTVKVAETIDGQIVADFITLGHMNASIIDVGELTASIIKAGILADKGGAFSLNMATGELVMYSGTFRGLVAAATVQGSTIQGGSININNQFAVDSNGNMTAKTGTIGDFTLGNGEMYAWGITNIRSGTASSTSKSSYGKALATFKPSSLGVQSDFTITLSYYVATTAYRTMKAKLQYLSGGSWVTQQTITLDTSGSGEVTFNTTFPYTSSTKWRIYLTIASTSSSTYRQKITYSVYTSRLIKTAVTTGGYLGKVRSAEGIIGDIEYGGGQLSSLADGEGFLINSDTIELQELSDQLGYDYETLLKYCKYYTYVEGADGHPWCSGLFVKTDDTTSDTCLTLYKESSRICEINSYGQYSITRGSTTYTGYLDSGSSDERIKEDITELDLELSKNLIDRTKTHKFKYKGTEGHHYGVIAQEVREVLDELGETDSELEYILGSPQIPDQRNVRYEEYIAHIINYVKDLRAENEALRAEINEIKQILKERRN